MSRGIDSRTAMFFWFAGLCLLAWMPAVWALGLGGMQVSSALGEPLKARITLFAVPSAQQDSLHVRLGDEQAYEQHDVKRVPAIDAIDVRVERGSPAGGNATVYLTSTQPISSPLLELLVIAQTDDGRAVRKYTALLYPSATANAAPRANNASAPATASASSGRQRGATVTVAPDQTLWSISKRHKYPHVTIEQMLVAIYRANPAAFDGGINSMLVGSTLVMPSPQQVHKIDPAWAENWVESRT